MKQKKDNKLAEAFTVLEAARKQVLHSAESKAPSRPGEVTQRRYTFEDASRDQKKKEAAERAERTKYLLHPELWYDFDMWK